MEVLINLIVVIISQCAWISDHRVVHLKTILSESFSINFPSINVARGWGMNWGNENSESEKQFMSFEAPVQDYLQALNCARERASLVPSTD